MHAQADGRGHEPDVRLEERLGLDFALRPRTVLLQGLSATGIVMAVEQLRLLRACFDASGAVADARFVVSFTV